MSKKTEWVWLGSQPLDFGDQRVEPNVNGGTTFSRALSPEQEASYGGALVRADRRAIPEKKVTSGN